MIKFPYKCRKIVENCYYQKKEERMSIFKEKGKAFQ